MALQNETNVDMIVDDKQNQADSKMSDKEYIEYSIQWIRVKCQRERNILNSGMERESKEMLKLKESIEEAKDLQ